MLRSKLLPISKSVTAIVGVLVVAIFVGLAFFISRPIGQAVSNVTFGSVEISPNADGKNDITTISYQVWRDARVSIYFEDQSSRRFYFRHDETRTWGEYSVLFSGIVDGFVLDGESFKGNVVTRLMPDGEYKWVVEALDIATGNTERTTGELTVQGSDRIVPDILELTKSP